MPQTMINTRETQSYAFKHVHMRACVIKQKPEDNLTRKQIGSAKRRTRKIYLITLNTCVCVCVCGRNVNKKLIK